MSAAIQGRRTDKMIGKRFPMNYPAKASQTIFSGTIVMKDSSGRALSGATATGMLGAGIAKTNGGLDRWDNSAGNDGDLKVEVEECIAKLANSAAGDAIAAADVGKKCYIVDNQTVAKTDGTGTRSPAGLIRQVDTDGVWVEFNIAQLEQATV